MKKKVQKLTLNRETLRHLNTPELAHAIGAVTREIPPPETQVSDCEACAPPSQEYTCYTYNTNCTLWC